MNGLVYVIDAMTTSVPKEMAISLSEMHHPYVPNAFASHMHKPLLCPRKNWHHICPRKTASITSYDTGLISVLYAPI